MNITFIGGGNMARALIGGLLSKKFSPEAIRVIDIDEATRTRLSQEYGVSCHAPQEAEALATDILVLAIKPQHMRSACESLAGAISKSAPLVISIAAGLRLHDISRWLGGYTRIIRTMPNLPATVGAGITGLYAPASISALHRDHAEEILSAVGATLWVENESLLDAVTAISGSGPAYLFAFMEALQTAAEGLGFSEAEARQLVRETTLGSAQLAHHSSLSPRELREQVTSKGGTTEAALLSLTKHHFSDTIHAAVNAAHEQGQHLGEALSKN